MGSRKNRKSPRLSNYRYDSPNFYFVTICTYQKQSLLGDIKDSILRLNTAGMMVSRLWVTMAARFENVLMHEYVVMPDHIHGILEFNPLEDSVDGLPFLSTVIHWFKTMTTNEYIRGVRDAAFPIFRKKVWQRSFYDHVIRSESALHRIREYIIANPNRWSIDRCHPSNNKRGS